LSKNKRKMKKQKEIQRRIGERYGDVNV